MNLHLPYEVMELPADPGQFMVAFAAEAGTPADDALRVLASWAATHDRPTWWQLPSSRDHGQRAPGQHDEGSPGRRVAGHAPPGLDGEVAGASIDGRAGRRFGGGVRVLREILAGLDEPGWRRGTPAAGWTITDQVSHLAHFDDVAVQSAVRPDAFVAELERTEATGGIDPDAIATRYRELSGAQLLAWFDDSRGRLLATFRGLDPGGRVPWFGPPMSAASSLTARIMETWAHGQDVADAVGVRREPTARLRHVAHIGGGARAFSYALHSRELADAPIRVELAAPDGSTWTWGPAEAADRVAGPALDFALAITQRRHRDDLALTITARHAREWMEIGQAFAGTPGPGRLPWVSRSCERGRAQLGEPGGCGPAR